MTNSSYRIHHIRPRFKSNMENVLFFMAESICNIGAKEEKEFKKSMNRAIRFFPGNTTKNNKTINNWRTEIVALFGLVVTENGQSRPSDLAVQLKETGDLIQFFRTFLFNFQYPGGHNKPHETIDMISQGIRFKPAKLILNVLTYGTHQQNGKRDSISKEEATHLIFNNLDVTRGDYSVEDIYSQLQSNRTSGYKYQSGGDLIRYAGDILDYLVLADLLDRKTNGKYYPKMQHKEIIDMFINDDGYFAQYDKFYGKKTIANGDINSLQTEWQIYASNLLDSKYSATSIASIGASDNLALNESIIEGLTKRLSEISTTKQIGDLGEAITIHHERNRMLERDRKDLVRKIKKIPEQFAVGYDVKSFLGMNNDFRHIHIEVKSTISRNKLTIFTFTLTPNEFEAAKSHKDLYFIYRVFISTEQIRIFVIRNPIDTFRLDNISLASNGAIFSFEESDGNWESALI